MSLLPILAFPSQGEIGRKKKEPHPPGKMHLPTIERQSQRLSAQFSALEHAFESGRLNVNHSVDGLMLEQVLVMETIGPISEFYKAVRKIDGLEWLDEWERSIEPDDDFYIESDPEKAVSGRLYLAASNQESLKKIHSLWELYMSGETKFPLGQAKWKELFSHLHTIRNWNVEDRIVGTGMLEDWKERLGSGAEEVRFEIELWYRGYEEVRSKCSRKLKELLNQVKARVIAESIIPEIAYHSLLIQAPISIFNDILTSDDVQFVRSDHVMFLRPTGQAVVPTPNDDGIFWSTEFTNELNTLSESPIICMLDGLPVENHKFIRDRVIVDDPDGWTSQYPAAERIHGTAMASLIINGDMEDTSSKALSRPIYIRPVMRPNPRDWKDVREEGIPEDKLTIDLIHTAVRRLFEDNQETSPIVPSVKVINISLGDKSRVFEHSMSPWARLLDWLAWKYRVLFIVSAGNYVSDLEFPNIPRRSLSELSAKDLQSEYVQEVVNGLVNRRILSPAESINGLTVGATHYDSSIITNLGNRIDVAIDAGLPSPITRVGLGYRRSIKPDFVMPGGKQFYHEKLGTSHSHAILRLAKTTELHLAN